MTAAIFWLKTRGGWRETPQVHEVGHYDLGSWSDEELERVLEGLREVRAGPRLATIEHQRNRQSRVAQMMLRPGFALQRSAATREPTADELEVARTALDEVLRLEDSGGRP